MEFQKITKFLDINFDDKDLPKSNTGKWIEVYDQSEKNYNTNKEIRIKTSDLRDFSDAYIVVKGDITLEVNNDANKRNKNLVFKNNVAFINCISKVNGVKIDNTEDLDVVMPMYNLLEYSKSYKETTGSLWIIEINQVILFLLILNLLNIKQILQEKHQKIMIH